MIDAEKDDDEEDDEMDVCEGCGDTDCELFAFDDNLGLIGGPVCGVCLADLIHERRGDENEHEYDEYIRDVA